MRGQQLLFPLLTVAWKRMMAMPAELLKWAGRSNNIVVEILSMPGLYLQKLTTAEPDLKQLEVAIASVKAVLNDGDDVPYFEGICDLEGRLVEADIPETQEDPAEEEK